MAISPPAKWHKLLAAIVGALALAIAQRKLSRQSLREWSDTLAQVKSEMDDMLK